MAEDLVERVDFMNVEAGQAAIIEPVPSGLAQELDGRGFNLVNPTENLENPWLIKGLNYVFAIQSMATINDLPGALLHIRDAIAEGGMFFATFTGAGSLPAMRRVMLAADGDRPAPRIHPQIDNRAASALIERAGFRRQVVDSHTITAIYSSLKRLVGDLRDHGITSALADPAPALSKGALARAHATFDALRNDQGRVVETFEILTITAWR